MLLEKDFLGYKQGTELRDVTLEEARAMVCNQCGDCCNGLSEGVLKHPDTGMPLFTWDGDGSSIPADRYASRYGQPLLLPIIALEEVKELPYQGPIGLGEEWELNNNKPYTAFKCSMLEESSDGKCNCKLYNGDVLKPETVRPKTCGDFPVFGLEIDSVIIGSGSYVPATGNLPRCTWYGIRVTGPWKNTPQWIARYEKQLAGEEVPTLAMDPVKVDELMQRLKAKNAARKSAYYADRGMLEGTDLDTSSGNKREKD